MELSLKTRCLILGALSVAGLAVGVLGAHWLTEPAPFELQAPATSTAPLIQPDAKLTVDEVVRLQLASLRAYRTDDTALLQCFALASPANRAVTGPLERFAQMVGNPDYRALVLAAQSTVGAPLYHGRKATILVTVIDAERRMWVYRFYLSKQREAPYEDCWMTDAVTREGALTPPVEEPAADDVALDGARTAPGVSPFLRAA